MEEIKTDLFPGRLRAGKESGKNWDNKKESNGHKNVAESVEPLPESSRPRKDGPGGE